MCDHHGQLENELDRRSFLKTGAAAGVAGAAAVATLASTAGAAEDPYAPPAKPALPDAGMVLDLPRTALVVTDPQIDFLSPDGVTWGVVGKSVEHHGTVGNIERLFKAAKAAGLTVRPARYWPGGPRRPGLR